jgi:ABC-2 type transport system permease protein
MIILVKQECFKLLHKSSTYISSATLLLLMTALGFLSKYYPRSWGKPEIQFVQLFAGIYWIPLFMIAACSSIIAMEFQYGTIKELLYRKYYRGQILISKWITMFLYSVYFFAVSLAWSLVIEAVLFNDTFKLSDQYNNQLTIIHANILAIIGSFLVLWMILSLVLLLANVFRSAAAAISIGIVGYFGLYIIEGMMIKIMNRWEWLKWNPLNILNLPLQLTESNADKVTLLSTPEMVGACLGYTIILLALSYTVFKRRSV